jgi:hypothetical protein
MQQMEETEAAQDEDTERPHLIVYTTLNSDLHDAAPKEMITAGDRNRTDMTSLEGWGFTIKLRPHGKAEIIAVFEASSKTIFGFFFGNLTPEGSDCIIPFVRL